MFAFGVNTNARKGRRSLNDMRWVALPRHFTIRARMVLPIQRHLSPTIGTKQNLLTVDLTVLRKSRLKK